MIKSIIQSWEKNKHKLEAHFYNNGNVEYSCEQIVRLLFELCIKELDFCGEEVDFDISKMTIIDHGNWQGTQIFIIPREKYQPDLQDYIVTNNYYGSCSGCDTLLGIQSNQFSDEPISKSIVDAYMTFALHLVQKMKWLGNEEDSDCEIF